MRQGARFARNSSGSRRSWVRTCSMRRRSRWRSRTATTSRCRLWRCGWRCASERSASMPRVAGGGSLGLFYGDSRLAAPVYDYTRRFVASSAALTAELGPERLNAKYRAPAAPLRPFAERHPEAAVDCADCGDLRAGDGGAEGGAQCRAIRSPRLRIEMWGSRPEICATEEFRRHPLLYGERLLIHS